MQNEYSAVSADLPVACSLTQAELADRGEELHEVFSSFQTIQELGNGYALQFPGEKIWIEKLTDFISQERDCCPFFTFELIFEPAQGPIWLRLYGGEGVKEMIRDQLLTIDAPGKADQ